MESRIEGDDEIIIACAKGEFLKRGYADASLRTIAQNADQHKHDLYKIFTYRKKEFHLAKKWKFKAFLV